ncbi:MAG: hypothetical protein DMF75_02120 [Acidobacteria bacterium]|nr:MAG: hypothetical protein DMF75_02120 [Acidobacteriota bacterium]
MEVRLRIPDDIAAQLQPNGGNLERCALEALAIEGYRSEALSLGQVADMLGLSVDEADGFLKKRGIPLLSTIDDFDYDQQVLRELLA